MPGARFLFNLCGIYTKESLVWLLVAILEFVFTMQLGGKNAGIVFEDADLGKCIPTMIREVGGA